MAIEPTAAHKKAIIAVLDEEHADIDAAASAVLKKSWELFRERARFAVVGRVRMLQHKRIDESDDRAVRVLLDVYPTATQAKDAALGLAFGPGSADSHETWVVPCFFGSASQYYKGIKGDREDDAMADSSYLERELARRIAWVRDNPTKQLPTDMRGPIALMDPNELERRAA